MMYVEHPHIIRIKQPLVGYVRIFVILSLDGFTNWVSGKDLLPRDIVVAKAAGDDLQRYACTGLISNPNPTSVANAGYSVRLYDKPQKHPTISPFEYMGWAVASVDRWVVSMANP